MVGAYQEEKDVRMIAGDTVSVGGYQIKLVGVSKVPGPNYDAMRGTFLLTKNGNSQATLYPEKRSYFSSAKAGGYGDEDIYKITIAEARESFLALFKGQLVPAEGDKLPDNINIVVSPLSTMPQKLQIHYFH